mgnify:FL=1
MQNLAGHPKATAHCAVELQQAGVPIEVLDQPYGEPKSDVGGRLGDFTFRRLWYYWVVYGPMPLAQAETLYADPAGRDDVRAAGHCGCPHPSSEAVWYRPDGMQVAPDPSGKQRAQLADLVTRRPDLANDTYVFADSVDDVPTARPYVASYHVDSMAGLSLLARTITTLPKCEPEIVRAIHRER